LIRAFDNARTAHSPPATARCRRAVARICHRIDRKYPEIRRRIIPDTCRPSGRSRPASCCSREAIGRPGLLAGRRGCRRCGPAPAVVAFHASGPAAGPPRRLRQAPVPGPASPGCPGRRAVPVVRPAPEPPAGPDLNLFARHVTH